MMAEIYGRKDGLCKGIGGSMHLTDVSNGFLGTSGIVAAGIPHAAGAAWAAQIRKQGQVVLCFFGDGASKQGAFAETLNIASLWKLPIVFVMENNGYNVHTRTEQEDANRANGEDLSVKAKAYSMPGVTIDGRDPVAVYETVGAAVARARAGDGPTLVESQMYRLSAHGNIIAPPGVPLHFPEHEAIEKFGAPEEYEAALKGDPVPAFRGRLVADGTLTAEEADEHRRGGPRGDAGRGRLRPREPVPGRRISPRVRLRLEGGDRPWHTNCPTSPPSTRRSCSRWSATTPSSTSARTWPRPRTSRTSTRSARTASASRRSPRRPRSAWRSAPPSPASGRWSSCTWPSSCSSRWTRSSTRRHRFRAMSGGQVKVPLVLKAGYGFTAGWAGQHTGTISALFMGVPGLKVVVPSTAADAKGLMATAIRDDNPVVYLHNYLLTLEHGEVPDGEYLVPFGEAAIRREGGDVTIVGDGLDGRPRARRGRAARRGGHPGRGDRPAHARAARHARRSWSRSTKTGRLVLVDQATRHASAATVIAGEVAEHGFSSLKAPIVQVTALDATIPYSEPLEA